MVAYYMACFQVRPRRLFTAAAILKTNEENQNALTDFSSTPSVNWYENCKVVAVTAEKNVATVDKLSRFAAACCWANLIVGTPGKERKFESTKNRLMYTNFNKHRQIDRDVVNVLPNF
jgi:hypothetical protein